MSNNNPQQGQRPMTLQQQQQLWVRPEDIRRLLPHYGEEQKQQYEKGTQELYTKLERLNENDPNRQSVVKRLTDVSMKIRTEYKKYQTLRQQQQQRQQQQTGQAQAGPSAPQQGANRPVNGEQQPSQQSQAAPNQISAQIAASVQAHVQKFPFTTPPELQPGTEAAEKYLAEAKVQYAKVLNTMQTAKAKIDRITEIKNNRINEGKPLSATETENAQTQERSSRADYERAKKFLDDFRAAQIGYTRAQQRGDNAGEKRPAISGPASSGAGGQNPMSVQIPAAGVRGPGSATSPANSGAHQMKIDQQNSTNQDKSHSGPGVQAAGSSAQQPAQLPRASGNQNVNTASQQRPAQGQHASPASAHPASGMPPGPARAWSHQEAMAEAARSYGAGGHNTPGGPPAPFSQGQNSAQTQHSHPPPLGANQGEISTTKMPIPKSLPNPPPNPVSMGPSRPTYSGGASNSATGMMGQPAFQKVPPYVLGGEGERVLSKKKLDELVRQVTGGNEGLGGEGLSAEVEEAILQLADDFIDQVTTGACRLAKLRSSSTLEIRDIQLILERNYNIRIPGYSADEIRTVRKIAPAVGWSQKMSAVQAAKVTKDKGDL